MTVLNPDNASLLIQLVERLQVQESLEIEGKLAQGNLPTSLWPTVSAFANTEGGWILLGVKDSGDDVLVPVGVANAHQLMQQVYDNMQNPQKISYAACGARDVSVEKLGGLEVIVMRVPAAPRNERPVYVGGSRENGTYVRRAGGDYRCSWLDIDRMLRSAGGKAGDSVELTAFNLEDLDQGTIGRYRRRLRDFSPASELNSLDDREFLKALQVLRVETEGRRSDALTIAGLLMFGMATSIRRFRPNHTIDFRLLPGEPDVDVGWDDRVYWDGNLYDAFDSIYTRLTRTLPVPFDLDGPFRVGNTPAHRALREALINLLAHADYRESPASLVEMSPAGYFFRNPGDSRLPLSFLFSGNRSDPRNPLIIDMFRRVGLAETAGTGLNRMVTAWRTSGYAPPEIDSSGERYEFCLRMRAVHFLSAEDVAWLDALGSDFSEAEQLALVLARREGAVDNPTLRARTGQNLGEVTRLLGRLRDRGLLVMQGGKRGAWYQLGPTATPPTGPEDSDIESRAPLPTSTEDSSPSTEDSSPSTEDSSPSTEEIEEDLRRLAAPFGVRGRIPTQERDDIIVGLCAVRALSLDDLVKLLDRGAAHLHDVLRDLIAQGRLAYTYPQKPRHPQQRYVATAPSGQRPLPLGGS